MAPRSKQPLEERQLGRWRLIREFNHHLDHALESWPLHPTWQSPQRQLALADYLSLFLFGVFNPVVETMRGLILASHLPRVQEEVCRRSVSLGSFSEAQAVVDPALLKQVYDGLATEVAQRRPKGGQSANPYVEMMQIVDSTLWYALPRMHWAIWRTQYGTQRAFRLHVRFQLADNMPSDLTITPGRRCERLEWQAMAEPGDFYVGDRYYGEDYRLLANFKETNCHFAVRLRSDAHWIVEEQLPIDQAASNANVIWTGWVRLGKAGDGPRVRVVQIRTAKEVLSIATDLSPEQMSAELVSLCYRERWQVELFFRWLKHIMKANRWIAEGEEGVAIQIYLTLIAAQLFLLFTGDRPNRRALELLQFMMIGWATPEEVVALLKKQAAPRKKRTP